MPISNKDLISNTRRVTRSYRPDLLEMFKYGKKRLGLECHIDFRIGDIDGSHALALFKNKKHPRTVLISDATLEILNREELLFIIGHELAHIHFRELPQPEYNKTTQEIISAPDTGTPEVDEMAISTYIEMLADSKGVLVAGGVEPAISAYRKFWTKAEGAEDAVTRSEFAREKILMEALKLMDKSETYYDDIVDTPLFKTGKKLLSEEDFNRKLMDLFNEWPDCQPDQYRAMTESTDAAYYILLRDGDRGVKTLPEGVDWFRSYDYMPKDLSRFTGLEEAYSKIDEHRPILSKMTHPLKYRIFTRLVLVADETESDPYIVEDFVREIGKAFGFSSDEMRKYLSFFQHRFDMNKAS